MCRILFLLTVLLGLQLTVTAQADRTRDSLQHVFSVAQTDSDRLRAMLQIGRYYAEEGRKDDAGAWAKRAVGLATQINATGRLSDALILIGDLGHEIGDYATAEANYRKALASARSEPERLATAYDRLAMVFSYRGQRVEAIQYARQALAFAQKASSPEPQVLSLGNLGTMYLSIGALPQALDCFQQSLRICETKQVAKHMGLVLNQISSVYYQMEDYPQALSYCQRALADPIAAKDNLHASNMLGNIASIHAQQNDLTGALAAYLRVLALKKQIHDVEYGTIARMNMADVMVRLKRYPEALAQLDTAEREALHFNNNVTLAAVRNLKGQAWFKNGLTAQARKLLEANLPLVQEYGELIDMREAVEFLADVAAAEGDWKSAYTYQRKLKTYNDSLFNTDKSREIGQLEARFQFEQEDTERKRNEKEAARLEAETLERRNNLHYRTILAGLIGIFIGLAFMGRLRIPSRFRDAVLFIVLLLIFEFVLVYADPWLDQWTGGAPLLKLGGNTVLAIGFAPLHGWLETVMKRRLSRPVPSDEANS